MMRNGFQHHGAELLNALRENGVEIFADEKICDVWATVQPKRIGIPNIGLQISAKLVGGE